MLIAVVNSSTLITDDQAATMTQAVAAQAAEHFAPAWERQAPQVTFYPDPAQVPAAAHGVALVDTIAGEPAGVLGYHTEDARGQWGTVACKPGLDAGAQPLTGDWSVSSVLSHEVLELAADPSCSFWGASSRYAYCLEVCDPVEAPVYQVGGVSVSNFCLPRWWDPQARTGFDHLGLLKAPFTILPGGYMVYMKDGREQQKSGARFPAWRRDMKRGALARTRRRLGQAAIPPAPDTAASSTASR